MLCQLLDGHLSDSIKTLLEWKKTFYDNIYKETQTYIHQSLQLQASYVPGIWVIQFKLLFMDVNANQYESE
jgi:hypothetical protein